jgi:hypothetical protein
MRQTFGDSECYIGFRTIKYENIPSKVTHYNYYGVKMLAKICCKTGLVIR